MSTTPLVSRDERTVAVENASYKWAYILLSFALLIDVAYRAMFRNEGAWDLMALVIVGGAVCAVHQARQKTLAHGWAKDAVYITCFGGVIGVIVVAIMLWLRI
jgi:hypothetical protein